jgi:diaminopimelate epimerase
MGTLSGGTMRFVKYQALGNDYLVIERGAWAGDVAPARVALVCDRHRGVGSDGVLLVDAGGGTPRVRIFNPDGSEAGKSGNGLRIVARWLWDQGRVGAAPFPVDTAGGRVVCRVHGELVTVDMGRVSFASADVPVAGPRREVLRERLRANGTEIEFSAATVGNPHCVVLRDAVSADEARRLGPQIERHPLFPERTNVQFVQVLGRDAIRLEIWERGAGYTLASGSSSCAAVAVARRLGLVDAYVHAHMPGGTLAVEVGDDWAMRQTGPAVFVFRGETAPTLGADSRRASD